MAQTVDSYIATCTPDEQAELRRIQGVVYSLVPEVDQGISYALPAYLYKGKALLSCVVNKKFLSIYPYSGKVIDALAERLHSFEYTAGSVHFTLDHTLSDDLLKDIITAKVREIEARI